MICGLRPKGRLYQATIRLAGWPKRKFFSLGVSDKRVAEQKLAELVRKLERQAIGMWPSDVGLEACSQPLLSLLGDFLGELDVLSRSPATIRVYRVRIGALCRECGWTYLRDVSADSFERWRLRRQRTPKPVAAGARPAPESGAKQGRGTARGTSPSPALTPQQRIGSAPKSVNDSLNGMRTFLRWCERRGFLDIDPLRRVEKVRIRGAQNYRRALSAGELARFFEVVPVERATVYRVAYYTGLRRKELRGLKRGDFRLDGPAPVVRVPGTVSKNGRTQEIPLHPECVAALRVWWPEDVAPFAWAFRGHVPKMDTWRRDLVRAGIPFIDADGRRFDFHALRDTLCTHLHAAGVPMRSAMAIMRHSDPRLTMRVYTDERQLGLSTEIGKLPCLNCCPEDSIMGRVVRNS